MINKNWFWTIFSLFSLSIAACTDNIVQDVVELNPNVEINDTTWALESVSAPIPVNKIDSIKHFLCDAKKLSFKFNPELGKSVDISEAYSINFPAKAYLFEDSLNAFDEVTADVYIGHKKGDIVKHLLSCEDTKGNILDMCDGFIYTNFYHKNGKIILGKNKFITVKQKCDYASEKYGFSYTNIDETSKLPKYFKIASTTSEGEVVVKKDLDFANLKNVVGYEISSSKKGYFAAQNVVSSNFTTNITGLLCLPTLLIKTQ